MRLDVPRCKRVALAFEFIVLAREEKRNGLMVYAFGYLKTRGCRNAEISKENHHRMYPNATSMELESDERARKNTRGG